MHKRSFGWITIKIYNEIKGLKVPTYESRLDEAIAIHQELLKHVPNHERAWLQLGALFEKQEKLEESMAAFQRQVEISPNFAEAWSGLGYAFWKQENHAAAAERLPGGWKCTPSIFSF